MPSFSLPLSFSVALQCYARTFFVGAAVTTRGMQHLGFLFALDPALVLLHKDAKSLQEARERALPHCNSHTLMMPLLVGLVVHLEALIAKKILSEEQAQGLVQTTFSTLSALGDAFFGGSILTLWALFSALCVMCDVGWLAILWTCFLLLSMQIFRIMTFFMALQQGLAVLGRVRAWNLINWSQRMKVVNAVLVACMLYGVTSGVTFSSVPLWVSVLWLSCGAFLVAFCRVPRLLLVIFMASALCFSWYSPFIV